MCYPGKYLRLETFVSTTQPRSLKLVTPRPLSVYFDLLVDAAGAVFHPRGLLGADLHAVGCAEFVETLN